jgi:ATP synthase protein I
VNKQLGKRGITRLWFLQVGVILLLTAIAAVITDAVAAKSVLLGGIVYMIPNVYFAFKLFKYQGARAARQIVNSFYKGEALKMILTMVLFALVFATGKVNGLAFFTAYMAMFVTHWFAPWVIEDNKQNRQKSD